MRVEEIHKGNLDVFYLSGKVMGGEDVMNLCGDLKNRLTTGNKNVVIDLTNVEWTNSCGLGMLIGVHISAINAGGRLALANIESIRKLLTMTRLIEVLDTYETLDEAVRSFEVEKYDPDF